MRPSLPAWIGRSASDALGMYAVCFICTGNICRSPMAEVVLRTLAERGSDPPLGARLDVSSAGTTNWHEGKPMDPRARRALERAGYHDTGHVARPVDATVGSSFDLVVGLDRRHVETLRGRLQHQGADVPTVLLRAFDPVSGGDVDVADPYYGEEADFDECLAVIEAGCRGLLAALGETVGPMAPTMPDGERSNRPH